MKPSRETAGGWFLIVDRAVNASSGMCLHDREAVCVPEPVYFPSVLSLATTSSYDAKEFIDSATEGTFCAYFQCSEHHIRVSKSSNPYLRQWSKRSRQVFAQIMLHSIYTIRMTQHTGAFVVVHAALHMLAKQVYMYPTPHAGRDFPMLTSDSSCARAPSPVASGNSLTLLRNFATFQLGFPGGTPISHYMDSPRSMQLGPHAQEKAVAVVIRHM
ncbi:hypothetical protein C8R45DRAFT_943504 [Mycena sanguinolenta]|nr:hypothetical protein C8R45DRAFT_943504 [Mycena sanguinolenta]